MTRFTVKTDTNWGTFRSVVEAADTLEAVSIAAERIQRDVATRVADKGVTEYPAVVIRHQAATAV